MDLSSVKKSVLSSVWLVCSECLKERTMIDGEPAASHDIVVCLKCGFQVKIVFSILKSASTVHGVLWGLAICRLTIYLGYCFDFTKCQYTIQNNIIIIVLTSPTVQKLLTSDCLAQKYKEASANVSLIKRIQLI